MKYISSEKITKNTYKLTIQVTENDMLWLEDLGTVDILCEHYQKSHGSELSKWLTKKLWHTFWALWKVHDSRKEPDKK